MSNRVDKSKQVGLARILIIESKPKMLEALEAFFSRAFPQSRLTYNQPLTDELPDLGALSDYDLVFAALDSEPDKLGAWLKALLKSEIFIPVVIIDSLCDADETVEYMRLGAVDFLCKKKLDGNRLRESINAASKLQPQKIPDEKKAFSFEHDSFAGSSEKDDAIEQMIEDQTDQTGVISAEAIAHQQALAEKAKQAEEKGAFSADSLGAEFSSAVTSGVFTRFTDVNALESFLPFSIEDMQQGKATVSYYKIIDLLGVGGAAAVFKVMRERDGDISAMKIINNKAGGDPAIRERFIREFEMSKTLDKKHIVDIYAQGFEGDISYSVMEYLPDMDLRTKIRNRIGRDKAISYTRQAAMALQELHAHDIIHRDLKPSNIMFRHSGALVLVDFGVAKRLNQTEASLTGEGEMVGTPSYVSPEQALGGEVDSRCDLYALGVILYQMIENRLPFEGKTAVEVMTAHVSKPVPLLTQEWDELNDIVAHLMAKDPNDRFQTAAELLAALGELGY